MKTYKHFVFRFLSVLLLFMLMGSVCLTGDDVSLKKLDEFIQAAMKESGQPGLAFALVKDGKVIFMKGYGVRNIETGEKITPQSLFNIASCSKAFTTALIAQLAEEGLLKWDDRVIDAYPEFRVSDPWVTSRATFRDLLSHRMGFATFDGDLLWYETGYGNDEIVRRMRDIPQRKEFRSEFGYQNNTYIVAGEVIARLTKKTWGENLTEKILNPLGMKNTFVCGADLKTEMDIASPHHKGKKYAGLLKNQNPAASMFSCVEDLTIWMRALLAEGQWNDARILKPESIENLFSPNTVFPSSKKARENGSLFRAYALGWGVSDYYGHRILEHSGGMPGYISLVTLLPEQKLGLVTLINDEASLPWLIKSKVLDMFLSLKQKKDWLKEYREGKKAQEENEKKQLAERESKRVKDTKPSLPHEGYTGKYTDKVYGDALVQLKDGVLTLTLVPAAELFTSQMNHWHYNTFHVKFRDEYLPFGLVTFSFDSVGKVIGFKIDLPNPDFHFYQLDFKRTGDVK